MDKGRNITSLWIVLSVVLLVVVGYVCVNVVQSGLTRVKTRTMFGLAREDWQRGRISKSLQEYIRGTWMVLEGGVRWSIAQVYWEQSMALCRKGQLPEGFDKCITATRVLGGYDNEGALALECMLIDMSVKNPEYPLLRPWLISGAEDANGD